MVREADSLDVVPGAGGDKAIDSMKVDDDDSSLEQVKHIASAATRGYLDCGSSIAGFERGIGPVIEQQFNDDEAVVAAQGLVQRGVPPVSPLIRVGPVLQCELHAMFVVPVGFAKEDGVEACLVKFAAFENDFEYGIVVAFRHVIRGLSVIGIGPPFEQKARELRLLRNPPRTIDGALKCRGED